MKFSEEQLKDIVMLKEDLFKKIEEHQDQIRLLEKNLVILDISLKGSSFTKASQMVHTDTFTVSDAATADAATADAATADAATADAATADAATHKEPEVTAQKEADIKEIPIKKGEDVLAIAYVTSDNISIVISSEINLEENTPPLKSFFIDRIIGGMKQKDQIEIQAGRIPEKLVIGYTIHNNETTSTINRIDITNYKQEDRVIEIVNTAGWSFARMLEKTGRQ